jgi:tetratricopeptide (TPR) repeat protein
MNASKARAGNDAAKNLTLDETRALEWEARRLADGERFLEALSKLDQIAESADLSPALHYLLAYCLHSLRGILDVDYERVLRHYEEALAGGYDAFWVRYNRGMLFHVLGRHTEADQDLRIALAVPGDDVTKETIRGIVRSMQKVPSTPLARPALVLCVPKCGTMLLHGLLSAALGTDAIAPNSVVDLNASYLLNTRVAGRIYFGHLMHETAVAETFAGAPKVILVRDPRDYVVANAHFQGAGGVGREHWAAFLGRLDSEGRFGTMILGASNGRFRIPSVRESFEKYALRWMDDRTLVVKYEHLIGDSLGGSDQRVYETITAILEFVGVRATPDDLRRRIADGSQPARSPTFRRGGSGAWHSEFTPRNKEQFRTVEGGLLQRLGYEIPEDVANFGDNDGTFAYPMAKAGVISRYERLLELSRGSSVQTILAMGWAANELVEVGAHAEAEAILARLQEAEPDNPRWPYLRGFALQWLRNATPAQFFEMGERSLSLYTTALALGTADEFWIRYHRALINLSLARPQNAADDLRRALELRPADATVKDLLARLVENAS